MQTQLLNTFTNKAKADALKDSVAKAKNITRQARSSQVKWPSGGEVKKVLGDDSASFKFKIKNKK